MQVGFGGEMLRVGGRTLRDLDRAHAPLYIFELTLSVNCARPAAALRELKMKWLNLSLVLILQFTLCESSKNINTQFDNNIVYSEVRLDSE